MVGRRFRCVVAGAIVAASAWSLSACSSYWVAHATTNGRAFIARGGTMYNCDATQGRPRCWPVSEVSP